MLSSRTFTLHKPQFADSLSNQQLQMFIIFFSKLTTVIYTLEINAKVFYFKTFCPFSKLCVLKPCINHALGVFKLNRIQQKSTQNKIAAEPSIYFILFFFVILFSVNFQLILKALKSSNPVSFKRYLNLFFFKLNSIKFYFN